MKVKTNIQIMADIMCIGCESGSDCGHWHPPIPKNLNEFELDEWFDNQAEILEMKKLEELEEMKEEEEVIFESEEEFVISDEDDWLESKEEFVISDEEEEESEHDIASVDEVQIKSKLKSTSPEWNPLCQWPIRCVNCQEKYPEDHDGEGFEQGGWYCPECWDMEFF